MPNHTYHHPKTYLVTSIDALMDIGQLYPEWEDFRQETQEELENLLGSEEEACKFYNANKEAFMLKDGLATNQTNKIILGELEYFEYKQDQQLDQVKEKAIKMFGELCEKYDKDPAPIIEHFKVWLSESTNFILEALSQTLKKVDITLSDTALEQLFAIIYTTTDELLSEEEVKLFAAANNLDPETTNKLKENLCTEAGSDALGAILKDEFHLSGIPDEDIEQLAVQLIAPFEPTIKFETSSALNNPYFYVFIADNIFAHNPFYPKFKADNLIYKDVNFLEEYSLYKLALDYFKEHPLEPGDKVVFVHNDHQDEGEMEQLEAMYPGIKTQEINYAYGDAIIRLAEKLSAEANQTTHPDDEMFQAHYDANTHVSSEG
jgi:hypothetical protein